jgi:hypothetical protein
MNFENGNPVQGRKMTGARIIALTLLTLAMAACRDVAPEVQPAQVFILTIGSGNDPYALLTWNEFHEFILIAKTIVGRRNGCRLYLDLHGQSDDARRQLGYLLSAQDLRRSSPPPLPGLWAIS